jgi:hypothetical protein
MINQYNDSFEGMEIDGPVFRYGGQEYPINSISAEVILGAQTSTSLRLGVPPTLARTLRSTNAIESMISVCREHASNVKRWRDGQMALRWCAAGMVEAGKQFRRVNGHLHLPTVRAALERETAEPVVHNDQVSAA